MVIWPIGLNNLFSIFLKRSVYFNSINDFCALIGYQRVALDKGSSEICQQVFFETTEILASNGNCSFVYVVA